MTTVRRHAVIHGIVQGVWFRASTRREALRLGVNGWVRNRPDGTVELVAEGPAPAVDELVAWCHHGPGHSRVDRVEVSEEDPMGETGFTVRT